MKGRRNRQQDPDIPKVGFCRKVYDNRIFLLLVAPGTLFLIIFFYIPVIANLVAFQDFQYSDQGFWYSLFHSPFVGLKNFQFFFASSDFWIVLRNTVGYNLIFLGLNFFFAIFFGVVMSQLRNRRLLKVYQTSMLFPYFISWPIMAAFLYAFLSADKGVVNHWIQSMHGTPIDFYNTPWVWPFIIIFLGVWKGIGYNSILYFATAMGIDPAYYDAAMIDGANKWQQIKNVTLPHIMPVALLMLILNIGGMFKTDIGLFYIVPKASAPLINVTQTFDTYIYRALSTSSDLGMTTAAGLMQSVVGVLLIVASNAVIRKLEPESALF